MDYNAALVEGALRNVVRKRADKIICFSASTKGYLNLAAENVAAADLGSQGSTVHRSFSQGGLSDLLVWLLEEGARRFFWGDA